MPSSSCSSRTSACSGVSPASTLPPGNSQRPAIDLPSGRWAISTRPSGSTRATAATSTSGRAPSGGGPPGHSSSKARALKGAASRTVAAVDVDVAVREIAGPDGGAAAADPEIDVDQDVGALDVPGDRRLVIVRHDLAAVGDLDAADRDPELVAVGALARLADRHDDAAPVGVLAGDGGLDQRRVGDRQADLAGSAVRRSAADTDGDEFGGTFAV